LSYKQPDNIDTFLIEVLKQRKIIGNRSIVYGDTELQNIFALYDLKGAGFITKEQCREALKTLANSEFHHKKAHEIPMPEKVDLFGFMKLCDDALGIKP
jgi:Ca2+-binding EF-hand superfamily protein